MIRKKTVFIVGAGASFEVGMPLGAVLLRDIAQGLDFRDWGDRPSQLQLAVHQQHDFDVNRCIHAGNVIRSAAQIAKSIDAILNTHQAKPEVVLIGKMAIAQRILHAERQCLLYAGAGPDVRLDQLEQAWLPELAHALFEDAMISDLDRIFADVSFIVFNYDRCLEEFLAAAMVAAFAIPRIRAQALVSEANILHPYGTVGCLPWQGGASDVVVPFGYENAELYEVARGLKTFFESRESEVEVKANAALADAETAVFLGCAYHRLNIELLSLPTDKKQRIIRIIGTALGVPQPAIPFVHNLVWSALGNPNHQPSIEMHAIGCRQLIADYTMTLTH